MGFVVIILTSVLCVFCGWALVRAFLCWCFFPLSSLVLCVSCLVVCVLVVGVSLFSSCRVVDCALFGFALCDLGDVFVVLFQLAKVR